MLKIIKKAHHLLSLIIILLFTTLNKLSSFFKNVRFGKKVKIRGLMYIKNKGKLVIGDYVIINSSSRANPIGCGNRVYIRVGSEGTLEIGRGSKISNSSLISDNGRIKIGDYVHIGSGCKLFSTDFHSLNPYHRMQVPEDSKYVKVGWIDIGNHVYLGASVMILKNVKIGCYSIIGAGSLVTRDVPPREVWGGVPAKKIRNLTDEELEVPYNASLE